MVAALKEVESGNGTVSVRVVNNDEKRRAENLRVSLRRELDFFNTMLLSSMTPPDYMARRPMLGPISGVVSCVKNASILYNESEREFYHHNEKDMAILAAADLMREPFKRAVNLGYQIIPEFEEDYRLLRRDVWLYTFKHFEEEKQGVTDIPYNKADALFKQAGQNLRLKLYYILKYSDRVAPRTELLKPSELGIPEEGDIYSAIKEANRKKNTEDLDKLARFIKERGSA